MSSKTLVRLRDELISQRDGCKYLDDLAEGEDRALTADENAKYDVAVTRMEALANVEIPAAVKRQEAFDKVAEVTSGITDHVPTAKRHESPARTESTLVRFDASKAGTPYVPESVPVEELGDFALTLGRARMGKITPDEANETLGRFGWEIDETLQRAVAHGVAADGTAPVTIEGDLIKFVDANRYAVNASRRLPMPDNKAPTFKRPRVTQRTTAGKQVTEGDVLSSQRMQLTGDTVTKETHGGVLSLSEQEIDWTEPAMLGLAIQDLAESYAIDTDNALCDAIEAALTASVQTVVSLTAASDVFIAALAKSAVAVFGTSKKLADTLFCSIDRWGYLAGLCDSAGRPIFPMVGPNNAAGSNTSGIATFTGFNIMGLDLVVDPNFTANVWGTAVSSLVESYEQNKGLLSIAAPSTLEVQYAYRGYFAANVYTQGVNALETS